MLENKFFAFNKTIKYPDQKLWEEIPDKNH
jgi:hypothetical protein